VHEIIYPNVESNLTGFQNLSGLVVDFISCTFLSNDRFYLKKNVIIFIEARKSLKFQRVHNGQNN